MSMNNNVDKYMYVNWEDDSKNLYRVAILARIDGAYYLKVFGKKDFEERDAFSHGYDGIPGFRTGEIYKSDNQIFDFFKSRVRTSAYEETDYMEELSKTSGKLLTDSFSISEMPEKYISRCKQFLIKLSNHKDLIQKKDLNIESK